MARMEKEHPWIQKEQAWSEDGFLSCRDLGLLLQIVYLYIYIYYITHTYIDIYNIICTSFFVARVAFSPAYCLARVNIELHQIATQTTCI